MSPSIFGSSDFLQPLRRPSVEPAMEYLHLHLVECGVTTRDEDGAIFADLDQAKRTAMSAARGIMSAEILEGRLCISCHIEIARAGGEALAIVRFDEAVTVTGVP